MDLSTKVNIQSHSEDVLMEHAKDAYLKNPRAFISSLGTGASDSDNRKLSELLKHPVLSLMRKNTYQPSLQVNAP